MWRDTITQWMFRLSRDYAFISSSTGGQNYIFSPSSVLACLQVAGQTGSQEARKVITKTSPGTRNGEERRGFIIFVYILLHLYLSASLSEDIVGTFIITTLLMKKPSWVWDNLSWRSVTWHKWYLCQIKINILLAHNASSVHYIRHICQISIISQSDGARRRQIYNSIKIHYLAFQLQSLHILST